VFPSPAWPAREVVRWSIVAFLVAGLRHPEELD